MQSPSPCCEDNSRQTELLAWIGCLKLLLVLWTCTTKSAGNKLDDAMGQLSMPTAGLLSCRASEQCRRDEVLAAVVLQSCWRGTLQRKELQQLWYEHFELKFSRHVLC